MTTLAVRQQPGTRAARVRPEVVLLASGALVHLGNLGGAVVNGRLLGPAAFADLGVVTALLLLVVMAIDGLQLTAASVVADAPHRAEQVGAELRRVALPVGVAAGVLLVLTAPLLARTFRMASPAPLVAFAVVLPLGLLLGVRRGVAQGRLGFVELASSNLLEMGVRLVAAVVLVVVGTGVVGATIAIPLGMAAALLPLSGRRGPRATPAEAGVPARALGPTATAAGMALLAQVVVTQADTLAVRTVLEPTEAGLYVAVAMIGRAAFFACTTVMEVALPHLAGRDLGWRRTAGLTVAATAGLGTLAVVVSAAAPQLLLGLPFGSAYASAEPLLWRYAAASSLCAIGWVAVTTRVARGMAHPATVMAVAAVVQTVAVLAAARSGLAAAVDVQVVVMAAFASVELLRLFRPSATPQEITA